MLTSTTSRKNNITVANETTRSTRPRTTDSRVNSNQAIGSTKIYRENSNYSSKFSKWEEILIPEKQNGFQERSKEHFGYQKINIGIPTTSCGIYEWRVIKRSENIDWVVYIGKSCHQIPFLNGKKNLCSIKKEGLCNRIDNYLRDGSHLPELFNMVLRNRGSMWLRVQPAADNEEAVRMERDCLLYCDYSWNKVLNGEKRCIFPESWDTSRTYRENEVKEDKTKQFWKMWQMVQWPLPPTKKEKIKDKICEWKIKTNDTEKVVYISSSDTFPSNIRSRFENAVRNGGKIFQRLNEYSNKDEVEKKYLDKYNYAWNETNNIGTRNIFPWEQ